MIIEVYCESSCLTARGVTGTDSVRGCSLTAASAAGLTGVVGAGAVGIAGDFVDAGADGTVGSCALVLGSISTALPVMKLSSSAALCGATGSLTPWCPVKADWAKSDCFFSCLSFSSVARSNSSATLSTSLATEAISLVAAPSGAGAAVKCSSLAPTLAPPSVPAQMSLVLGAHSERLACGLLSGCGLLSVCGFCSAGVRAASKAALAWLSSRLASCNSGAKDSILAEAAAKATMLSSPLVLWAMSCKIVPSSRGKAFGVTLLMSSSGSPNSARAVRLACGATRAACCAWSCCSASAGASPSSGNSLCVRSTMGAPLALLAESALCVRTMAVAALIGRSIRAAAICECVGSARCWALTAIAVAGLVEAGFLGVAGRAGLSCSRAKESMARAKN